MSVSEKQTTWAMCIRAARISSGTFVGRRLAFLGRWGTWKSVLSEPAPISLLSILSPR